MIQRYKTGCITIIEYTCWKKSTTKKVHYHTIF